MKQLSEPDVSEKFIGDRKMKTKLYYSTRQVADILKVKVSWIDQNVYRRRIPAPERSPSGSYMWSTRDIQRAAELLSKRKKAP